MIPLPLLEEFVGGPEGGRLSLAEALERTSRKESTKTNPARDAASESSTAGSKIRRRRSTCGQSSRVAPGHARRAQTWRP
jgi:hypothetical protein